MKLRWLAVGMLGLAVVAADPALARVRHKAKLHCAPQRVEFSWHNLLFGPAPQPNGCSPPVFEYGRFVGQDPDPNIRFQLRRNPNTGYYINSP